MKRVFKVRAFGRWARRVGLPDEALLKAVDEMERGLIDADLGGGVYKKRVALPGRGKRGSTRTILATNRSTRWFFMVGFEKKELANVTRRELEALRIRADDLLSLHESAIRVLLTDGVLEEVNNGKS